ncbi:MAG: hypothetical protein NC817_02075, partial [Candidatus Omnitrophica bacterium]|nr:hypothetical protein [Candidatus Omnitrophota bacterium]
MKFLPQGKHLNKDYFVAYSPQDKEVVVRIKGKFPSDEKRIEKEAFNFELLKNLKKKEIRIFQGGGIIYSPKFKGKPSFSGDDLFTTEIKIPLDSNTEGILKKRFNIPDGFFKAKVREERLSNDNIRIYLDDKIDGVWYKLSCSIPQGYSVKEIRRLDGKLIENKYKGNRTEGLVEEETL